ncbi:hypothetical protein CHH90_07045 [Bacillus licheniformis]|nr:hypothetical protein CHH90_07045 [Bacillus licheniformis]
MSWGTVLVFHFALSPFFQLSNQKSIKALCDASKDILNISNFFGMMQGTEEKTAGPRWQAVFLL